MVMLWYSEPAIRAKISACTSHFQITMPSIQPKATEVGMVLFSKRLDAKMTYAPQNWNPRVALKANISFPNTQYGVWKCQNDVRSPKAEAHHVAPKAKNFSPDTHNMLFEDAKMTYVPLKLKSPYVASKADIFSPNTQYGDTCCVSLEWLLLRPWPWLLSLVFDCSKWAKRFQY